MYNNYNGKLNKNKQIGIMTIMMVRKIKNTYSKNGKNI